MSLLDRLRRRLDRRLEHRALSNGYQAYFAYQRRRGFPRIHETFESHTGYPLNLDDPKTFNEKLTHRKVFGRDPIWGIVSDKVAVRDWLRENDLLREARLVPVVGIFDSVEALAQADLPDGVIVKAAWASARNFILRNSAAERDALLAAARGWIDEYPVYGVEKLLYYPQVIPPRILVEPLLNGADAPVGADDFKFFTFHGRVRYLQVSVRLPNGDGRLLFDRDGRAMDVVQKYENRVPFDLPDTVPAMRSQAERIGQHFDFARIDFYSEGGTIYMGEITQTPTGGHGRFTPEAFDHELGALWDYRPG